MGTGKGGVEVRNMPPSLQAFWKINTEKTEEFLILIPKLKLA
jgi:hypothetical protein